MKNENLNIRNNLNTSIFSIINKKNLVLKILNNLPNDLKFMLFQLSQLDKEIAFMAIKSGDARLINYMTNWDYEKIMSMMPEIVAINPNFQNFVDLQQAAKEFETVKNKNYINSEEIYLTYLSRLFDLRYRNINEFKAYVEQLIEQENCFKIKETDKEFYLKTSLSPRLEKDLKALYNLKIKRANKITEIAEIDKRYDEACEHIEKCKKKYDKKVLIYEAIETEEIEQER